jgi:hypothetical protein
MAPRRFLNRTEELASLQRRWDTGEAQLFTPQERALPLRRAGDRILEK